MYGTEFRLSPLGVLNLLNIQCLLFPAMEIQFSGTKITSALEELEIICSASQDPGSSGRQESLYCHFCLPVLRIQFVTSRTSICWGDVLRLHLATG